MNELRAFFPMYRDSQPGTFTGSLADGVTVAAVNATAVASAAFPGSSDLNSLCQIRIVNKTDKWVHVNFGKLIGGDTVTAASLASYAVGPGLSEVVSVHPEVNAASVFADGAPGSSTAVIFYRGSGTGT